MKNFLLEHIRSQWLIMLSNFLLLFFLVATIGIVNPINKLTHSYASSPSVAPKIYMWGDNTFGQLGDGTTTQRTAPVQVQNLSGSVSQVAVGGGFTLALKTDGTVWSWGANAQGELGQGTQDSSAHSTPGQVSNLTNIIAIATSSNNTDALALRADGTVWSWGKNNNGSSGDGDTSMTHSYYSTPIEVVAPSGQLGYLNDIVAIAVGSTNMALKSDGTVWTWGNGNLGSLGNGTAVNGNINPYPVEATISNVKRIGEIGGLGMYAIEADGTVWAWGRDVTNTNPELASLTTTDTCASGTVSCIKTPTEVSGLSNITQITVGRDSSGYSEEFEVNASGALYGTGTPYTSATQISSFSSGVVSASATAGDTTVLVLKNDGTIWGWGDNSSGQLGNGTTTSVSGPSSAVEVSNISNATAIAIGASSAALTN